MHKKMAKLHSGVSSAIRSAELADLTRRPKGKWSAAEILEHLNLTYLGTIKTLERRLAEGKAHPSSSRSAKRWQRIAVVRLGLFPPGRKSPEPAVPRGMPAQRVMSEILGNLARMDELITECERKFSPRQPIAEHPILGPLTAAEWRGFHLTHGRHHVKQLEVLKKRFYSSAESGAP